jgi:hypothetical protein
MEIHCDLPVICNIFWYGSALVIDRGEEGAMDFISTFLQLRMQATRLGARCLRRGLRLCENSYQANSGGYASVGAMVGSAGCLRRATLLLLLPVI